MLLIRVQTGIARAIFSSLYYCLHWMVPGKQWTDIKQQGIESILLWNKSINTEQIYPMTQYISFTCFHQICDVIYHFYLFNSLRANCFKQKHKHVFTISIIHPHWHDTGSWNPFSCKTRTCLFNISNIVAADDQAMQGDRTSAAMLLT